MPDDWSWFWAGEHGRTSLLREELEGLQATASASSAASARLSSQLRTLQGSIESRLQALSTAFDAYVELGDVREQLAGYPDTSAVRRDALKVLAVLAQGGIPEPVDGRDVDYWLVDAVNEVIGLASGGPPPAAAAGPSRQEHEMFVVAALGWLGRGELVSARVAPLLLGDGVLAEPQVLLWRAVVHGLYGEVLEAVRSTWQADLDLSAATWVRFARDTAQAAGPVETLRWVQDLLRGGWSPSRGEGPPPGDDRTALRSLVEALVGTGLDDERALLARARVLRARIEEPGAPEPAAQAEQPRTATTEEVQQALRDPDVGPGTRQALVAWVRPGFEAAAAQLAAEVAAEQPDPTVVHTELGNIEVGTDGPDPARLAQLEAVAAQRWATRRSSLLAPGIPAAVALVVGLVLLPTRVAALGVFLIVVGLVLVIVLVRAFVHARATRAELVAVRERIRQRVDEGRTVAVAVRTAALESKAEAASLARAITETGAPTGPSLR